MSSSAYVFEEINRDGSEGPRLSAQAQAFVELELPGLLNCLAPNARVADFGCGTGVISKALALNLPQGKVVGLDPDANALDLARKQPGLPSNLNFEQHGFGSLPKEREGVFDAAFTRLVLLHLPDPGAALTEMGRLLKPGGLIYVADCDDDYINFSPVEPWQAELLALMQEAQALRGGTRRLGRRLLGLLQERGFWPEGMRVCYYSTSALGAERWKGMFVPALGGMAARDLDFLVEKGRARPSKRAEILGAVEAYFSRTDVKAQLSTWHAWARKA